MVAKKPSEKVRFYGCPERLTFTLPKDTPVARAKPENEAVILATVVDQLTGRKTVWEPKIGPQERWRREYRSNYLPSRHDLIAEYKKSIVRVIKEGMLKRKQCAARETDDVSNPCYDCHIGRHKSKITVEPKDDDLLPYKDGYDPSCPIVKKVNERYRTFKLIEYYPLEEKIQKLSTLHSKVLWGMFGKTYLEKGYICFLSKL